MSNDINLYDYDLPEGMIALYPAQPRDSSRLMFLPRRDGDPVHRHFSDFPEYFREGDLLVLNDSRVFPARIHGHKKGTGGKVEIFLLGKSENGTWEALVRPGRRLAPGTEIEFADNLFSATLGERTESGGRQVSFHHNGDLMELIWKHGEVPLPPYISRDPEEEDKTRYQTIYAENVGAVAAPTAGFHFTDNIFRKLDEIGVEVARLTLHPGLGTFRPITASEIDKHHMHAERFSVSQKTADIINRAKSENRRVIAIGTTTVRALESSVNAAGQVESSDWHATEIFIKPPYEYKVIDGLLTNFHLPKSTLLLLVSALAGRERVLGAYREAIKEGYRFYSYGDAMLIL